MKKWFLTKMTEIYPLPPLIKLPSEIKLIIFFPQLYDKCQEICSTFVPGYHLDIMSSKTMYHRSTDGGDGV